MTSTNRRERAHRGAAGRDEVALTLRIDVPTGRVGPGKIALLEQIAQLGSISAAARTLRMSYRRAWELVDDLGRSFGRPAVTTQMGGSGGVGRDLVAQYRAIERKAHRAARSHLARLQAVRAGRP